LGFRKDIQPREVPRILLPQWKASETPPRRVCPESDGTRCSGRHSLATAQVPRRNTLPRKDYQALGTRWSRMPMVQLWLEILEQEREKDPGKCLQPGLSLTWRPPRLDWFSWLTRSCCWRQQGNWAWNQRCRLEGYWSRLRYTVVQA